MNYETLRDQNRLAVDQCFTDHGFFAAFSKQQFNDNKTPLLNSDDKYVSLGAGCYMPKSRYAFFEVAHDLIMSDYHKRIIDMNLQEDEVLYELNNHEAYYSYDGLQETIELFEGRYPESFIISVYNDNLDKHIEL